MSDLDNDLPIPSELDSLKARANQLGIKFHPSIGVEALREKVNAAVTSEGKAAPEQAPAPAAAAGQAKADTQDATAAVEVVEETPGQRNKRLKLDQTRLIRVRLTNMNPNKKDIPGEIFTVGNSVVGTIRKYVPYNVDEGWHIPFIMYENLRDRMCQVFVSKRVNGMEVKESKLIREFAVEVLPDLTPEELHDLAQRQAMAGSIDN